MKRASKVAALATLLLAASCGSDDLSPKRAQALVDAWIAKEIQDTTMQGGSSSKVLGVMAGSKPGMAEADLANDFGHGRWASDGEYKKYSCKEGGKAYFKQYNDGRWALTGVKTGCDSFGMKGWRHDLVVVEPQ